MRTPKYLLFHQVLEWCNKIRTERGKEPLDALPKGKRNDGNSCPCGTATGIFVGCMGWAETKHNYDNHINSKRNVSAVAEFVPRFDSGEFPELEL